MPGNGMNLSNEALWRGYLYVGLVVVIWSGFILVSRLGGTSALTAFDVTAVRYGTALVILLPIWFIRNPVNLFDWKVLVLHALYQGVLAVVVQMLLYMRAMEITGATSLGSLMALVPAISGFAAVPLLGEALTPWLMGGLLLVSAGAYVGNRTDNLLLRKKRCPT